MTVARSALQGGAFAKWVSGATYSADTIVWSPISYLSYIRLGAGGATSTDPSADGANWAVWGASRIKQVIAGTTQINSPSTTATTAVSANMAKSELRFLGAREITTSTNIVHPATVAKDGSAVRASIAMASEQNISVSWELTEWW